MALYTIRPLMPSVSTECTLHVLDMFNMFTETLSQLMMAPLDV